MSYTKSCYMRQQYYAEPSIFIYFNLQRYQRKSTTLRINSTKTLQCNDRGNRTRKLSTLFRLYLYASFFFRCIMNYLCFHVRSVCVYIFTESKPGYTQHIYTYVQHTMLFFRSIFTSLSQYFWHRFTIWLIFIYKRKSYSFVSFRTHVGMAHLLLFDNEKVLLNMFGVILWHTVTFIQLTVQPSRGCL